MAAEIRQLRALVAKCDAGLEQITYWHAGAPKKVEGTRSPAHGYEWLVGDRLLSQI